MYVIPINSDALAIFCEIILRISIHNVRVLLVFF